MYTNQCPYSSETSLRYAIHMITASSLVASKRGVCQLIAWAHSFDLFKVCLLFTTQVTKVDTQDIERVFELFVDVDRSREYLSSSLSHEYISESAMDVDKSQ